MRVSEAVERLLGINLLSLFNVDWKLDLWGHGLRLRFAHAAFLEDVHAIEDAIDTERPHDAHKLFERALQRWGREPELTRLSSSIYYDEQAPNWGS